MFLEPRRISLTAAVWISDAVDLRPTLFQVTGLDLDVMRPDTPSTYGLQVAVSVIGQGAPVTLSNEATVQFKWSYVLSSDDIYTIGEDVVVDAEDMNEAQKMLLRVSHMNFSSVYLQNVWYAKIT